MLRGYIRVSTKNQFLQGTSLQEQHKKLKAENCDVIYKDVFTGTSMARPGFDKLCREVQAGDTLVVCSLDRFARTANEAYKMILQWVRQGIRIRVLNLGTIEDTEIGRLILHVMRAFAEFERDVIITRMKNGRAYKRANDPCYKDGRPLKYTLVQMNHAMDLLKNYTYKEVAEMTGISKATIWRETKRRGISKINMIAS